MPYTDYDKYKDGDVTSKSGSPTINRTLTIELDPSVAESTTGTGAWGYDESICADAQDIGVYEPDGSGGWQLAPYQIENPEDIGTTNSVYIHVYSSYVRDGSEQIRVAYGNNSANTDRQTTTVFSNETDNHQTFFHNEASDPVVDYSGNNYDGDGVGITREVAGQIGEGHSADGTDDWIQATNYGGINPDNYTAWTFNYFIKTTESSNNWQIGRRESGNSTNRIDVRSNHDTVNVTSSSGSIGLTITDDTGNFSDRYSETYDNTGVFDGNWHMITVVLNWSGDLKLYIDGTEQSPSASTASYDPSVSAWNSNPLGLMGFADGTADADVLGPHQGDMDMWQFWTSELTQDEITARYEASPLGGHTFFSQQAAVKIKTVSSTHDAVLKNLGAETATAHDAAIQVEDKETAATEDAVIQNRDVEVQSIHDAVLQADLKTQTTHDVVLKNLDAETQATIDTAIQNSDLEASLTEDAVIMKQSEVSTTHDTVLENLDAEKNAVVDAALKKLDKETSLNIDSVVQDADIEVNTTHDTVLKAENQEAAATFDTVLETLDVEATGAWDTAIQDSGLEVTYTVDTVVKSRTDQNFVEDTYIAHGRPGAVTVYIDGTEYKKYANIKVKKRLNEMNDIEFEAFIEDSNDRALLQEGATVEIFEGTDNLLFKGRLNNVEYESNFKAKCEGFGMEVKLLNRKTPRVEYNNTGADDIVKQLVTTEIMQEGTIENAPVASLRFDHDNKLRAIAGTANAVGYDWYISQKKSEGYDKDYLNFVARKGSSTSQKTYDIGNNARMVERNKDTEHVANDITMLGRGDGVNQLEAHVFAASTHRTVTAERLKDTDTTSLDVKDASQLGADGDTVHVRVGTEVIEGTLDVTNNQVDISSRGANDYNGNSTEVITHYKSIQVWLQENVTQGIGPFKPTKSGAEAGSSIDTYGVREEKVTDRTIINKSTLEKVADNELKDRRQDIFRVQIKPTDPRTTKEIELGDTVTAKDLTAMDVNNEFRVVGMDINRASGAEGTVLHLANRPLRLTERLRDIKRETDTTSTHMQGA
ncbi:MAG: hypothetical protein SVV03_02365, partial [Candidatus Nanohaloarchaea archaeon]|nr:hypothetical protein [Candidatus Nanohaloarchaea archaeon]